MAIGGVAEPDKGITGDNRKMRNLRDAPSLLQIPQLLGARTKRCRTPFWANWAAFVGGLADASSTPSRDDVRSFPPTRGRQKGSLA